MSQERTRFPIQPGDVRRSAKSNKHMAVPGKGAPRGGSQQRTDQDKPTIPPKRRKGPDKPQGD